MRCGPAFRCIRSTYSSIPWKRALIAIDTISMEYYGNLQMTPETAAQLNFGAATILPVAVITGYLHVGTGKPAALSYDGFMAALASLLRRDVAWRCMQTATQVSFANPACRPRQPAIPTRANLRCCSNFCPAGAHLWRRELRQVPRRLRHTEGIGLLWGPESKPVLDPIIFLQKEQRKRLNLSTSPDSWNALMAVPSSGALEEKRRHDARPESGKKTMGQPAAGDVVWADKHQHLLVSAV